MTPEEAIPPLPLEPYSVVRAYNTNEETQGEYVLRIDAAGNPFWQLMAWGTGLTDDQMRGRITGFEVLAEPVRPDMAEIELALRQASEKVTQVRRETAKVVLAEVRRQMEDALFRYPKTRDLRLDLIAEDFDVLS